MGVIDKIKKMWNPPEDEYEYYDDEYAEDGEYSEEETEEVTEEQPAEETAAYGSTPREKDRSYSRPSARTAAQRPGKVLNMNNTQLKFALFQPNSFGEETRTIADELMQKNVVVVNLETTDKTVSRRIIDFLGGVAYANNGKIKRIATSAFVIVPFNIDFTGDGLLDELENNGIYF